jgi:hypothetical protein
LISDVGLDRISSNEAIVDLLVSLGFFCHKFLDRTVTFIEGREDLVEQFTLVFRYLCTVLYIVKNTLDEGARVGDLELSVS